MIEKVHEHILEELRINAKTDTIFILTTLVLIIALLSTNAIIASDLTYSDTNPVILGIFIFLTLAVSFIAEIGLIRGRQASRKLIEGLIEMYKDQNVDKYYNPILLKHYKLRYNLFITVILMMGVIAVVIPLLLI